jgi:hypothetical protein
VLGLEATEILAMMKTVTNLLGALLCLTALVGFFSHEFMNMVLNPLHCTILLVLGAVSLYFGIRGTEFQARYVCRTLGVLFTVLGIATLMAGPGIATAGNVNIESSNVLKLIPDHLEYSTADGVRNLIVGIVGLIAGFFPRQKEIEVDMKAQEAKQKMASGR